MFHELRLVGPISNRTDIIVLDKYNWKEDGEERDHITFCPEHAVEALKMADNIRCDHEKYHWQHVGAFYQFLLEVTMWGHCQWCDAGVS